jgi:hypothetical protein
VAFSSNENLKRSGGFDASLVGYWPFSRVALGCAALLGDRCESIYADAVNSGPGLACHRVAPLYLADIESLDQSLLDSKYMTDHFIR